MKRGAADEGEDPLVVVEKESAQRNTQEEAKRTRKLEFAQLYASALPSAQMYERSYMHRDTVTHTAASKLHFIITASADGHVKFWKKVCDYFNPLRLQCLHCCESKKSLLSGLIAIVECIF
jgi:hypothetical protein